MKLFYLILLFFISISLYSETYSKTPINTSTKLDDQKVEKKDTTTTKLDDQKVEKKDTTTKLEDQKVVKKDTTTTKLDDQKVVVKKDTKLNDKKVLEKKDTKLNDKKVTPKSKKKIGSRNGLKPVSTISQRIRSFFGVFLMLFLAFLLSFKKSEIWKNSKRVIIGGLMIQFSFAIFVMKIPLGETIFKILGNGVNKLLSFTNKGTEFVFGSLYKTGFSFALNVLPTIIFFSAFMGILYYFGIMQFIVKILAKAMAKVLGTSGGESLNATANIFLGQTEAPLVIKPFIQNMTMSELNAVMIGGFATVAGGVLAAYIGMGVDPSSLIAASVMAAPGALVIAKIIYPETEESQTMGVVNFVEDEDEKTSNVIEAAAKGAGDGLQLALNVGAMLLAFVALIFFANYALEGVTGIFLDNPVSLSKLLGWIFSPIAYSIGIDWNDAQHVGRLLGEKLVINEFVAFAHLNEVATHISDRSLIITTFALTGFANFASIAIQIGGIGSISPKRKKDLAKLGLRAMLGGTIVALINGAIAGLIM